MGGGGNPQYSPLGELIPNLTRLALENVNFSSTISALDSRKMPQNIIGGFIQTSGVNGTSAGSVGLLCGIPLNKPIFDNFKSKYFLSNAICVSDILADLGYKQAFFSSIDASFAGKKAFFEAHGVEARDLPYFQKANLVPKRLPREMQGAWGLRDTLLFEFAKAHLEAQESPFAMYIYTIDTHEPGFVDKAYCPSVDVGYQNTFSCSDKLLADFVAFVKNSRFGENTTIIVLGDHLNRSTMFSWEVKRFVYNAFINPRFTREATLERTKNRALSHYDIAPLILDSLGIRTESFGLGRNPLYGKTLLEDTFNLEEFNNLLSQRNKMYDNFWRVE